MTFFALCTQQSETKGKKRWVMLICNHCDQIFQRTTALKVSQQRLTHYCSRACAAKAPKPGKRLTLGQVKKRLQHVHGDVVVIVDSTYTSSDKKAKFIDRDYGEWHAQVKSVLAGRRHTLHKNRGIVLTPAQINQRIAEAHGDDVRLQVGQRYVDSHTKLIFVDRDYGEWLAMPYSVFAGHGHPLRGHSKAMRKMRTTSMRYHWLTGEELICVGSYEAAVVDWFNANMIDFDWQVPVQSFDDRTYFVDALIKTGEFAGTFIEIKGHWMQEISRKKWEHFHARHLGSSELWDVKKLQDLGIKSP